MYTDYSGYCLFANISTDDFAEGNLKKCGGGSVSQNTGWGPPQTTQSFVGEAMELVGNYNPYSYWESTLLHTTGQATNVWSLVMGRVLGPLSKTSEKAFKTLANASGKIGDSFVFLAAIQYYSTMTSNTKVLNTAIALEFVIQFGVNGVTDKLTRGIEAAALSSGPVSPFLIAGIELGGAIVGSLSEDAARDFLVKIAPYS